MMNIFRSFKNLEDVPGFDSHKEIIFLNDKTTGLRGCIAIYNDNLGPSLGATRMWPYENDINALEAALNLSKTMAYKCALAGIRHGGAKGVIIGDSKKEKTKELLGEYARRVDALGGRFMTGTDVGLTDEDVEYMRGITPYMIGTNNRRTQSPSEMAALGVFYSIEGCFEEIDMERSLAGKTFAVKGLGKTGSELVRLLIKAGGKVMGADIDKEKVASAKKQFPEMKILSPETIHKQEVDVFAPCAVGRDLNSSTIKGLNCRYVIGTENNQLENKETGDLLYRLGIIYAPDYVVNAGGLIDVAAELDPEGYNAERVEEKVQGIKSTIKKIVARAKKEKKPTHQIADQMAEEILSSANKKKRK